eukprot:3275593-Ditylum_brightwellii.AAC.2
MDKTSIRKVRVLNTTDELSIPIFTLSPLDNPDPADILQQSNDIDPNALESLISKDSLEKLWNDDQVILSDDLRLYLY